MERFIVHLTSLDDIKYFVSVSCMQNFEISAVSGRYIINAKSITGMFCVILEKPIHICIKDAGKEEFEAFYKAIEKFVIT